MRFRMMGMNLDRTWTQGVQKYEKGIKKVPNEPIRLAKTDAELIRMSRNGGVKRSIFKDVYAFDIEHPWTKDAISVDEGMKNNKFFGPSDSIQKSTKVPPDGNASAVAQDVRKGLQEHISNAPTMNGTVAKPAPRKTEA
eukprot:Plantae.Rhodophyta-Purpureofilum_apyrenoidigerum.ctg10226.p1 GENE.Plantae.Rhodophyta-Purpureofilum_apyrenoidigerum.ctg10226~~Plantae.Rhodophyta-Purpureofilum_apyrenoidigerum.ctg10226.p1  ORF type:complete len:139 (+),score=26.64 Plantae.Rhodophyta-Purpureofilum_apyrenoidigerum.ctg10226:796-1212(+)